MTIIRFASILCLLLLCGCGNNSSQYDYKIALDPEWYSIEIEGRQSALTAFSSELIVAIGETENMKIGVFQRSWSNLMLGLQENDCQAICSPMQPYLFYEKLYAFSDIYLATGPVIVSEIHTAWDSLKKLEGQEVGVLRGSSYALILEKYPQILQRTYDSIQAALDDVKQGVIQAVILDALTAEAFTRDLFRGQLKISSEPLTDEGIRLVGLPGNSEELIRKFNKGLARVKAKGTYAKIAKKWGLGE